MQHCYYFYHAFYVTHIVLGMHRKYSLDLAPSAPSPSNNTATMSTTPPPKPPNDTIPMEEGGGESEVEETSDLDTTQESEALKEMAAYFPVLTDHLSQLGEKISANTALSSKIQRNVSKLRCTQIGMASRILRTERDGVRG